MRVADWENLMQCSLLLMKALFTVKLSNVVSLWPTREIVRKGQQQGKKCINTGVCAVDGTCASPVPPLKFFPSAENQYSGLESLQSLVTLKIKTWSRPVCREWLEESYPLNPRSMFPSLFEAGTQWCHHLCTFSLLLLPLESLPFYPSPPRHAASHLFLIATGISCVGSSQDEDEHHAPTSGQLRALSFGIQYLKLQSSSDNITNYLSDGIARKKNI